VALERTLVPVAACGEKDFRWTTQSGATMEKKEQPIYISQSKFILGFVATVKQGSHAHAIV
jgi:hypothetical protein